MSSEDQQDYLAETFRQQDYRLAQECKIAYLKIQSWQFVLRTPDLGAIYRHAASKMIHESLLSFVPNTFVLNEVGYYLNVTNN